MTDSPHSLLLIPTTVYVMVLDYFYDDYKRPEGSCDIIGVKTDYHTAYKTLLKLEYEKNLHYYGEDGKVTEKSKKYYDLYISLESISLITDSLLSEWEDARETYLGDSQFGVCSTGYRANVHPSTLDFT